MTALSPVLPLSRTAVFFDGLQSTPRLAHPEGVAVDRRGRIWCGTEHGDLVRIAADGSRLDRLAGTGGFLLGLAFDRADRIYACDLLNACVWRFDQASGALDALQIEDPRPMRVPNYPTVDHERNCLYVSDSHAFGAPGPGIWRFDLASGCGRLWCDRAFVFANGMALAPDGGALYVAETFARRVVRLPIDADGQPGEPTPFVTGIERLPDGLAFDTAGRLYISCYEPSRVFRADLDGRLELLIDDPEAHLLCHPTNIAFRGATLFAANLGRWHVTAIDTDATGLALL
jgi:sugar lactone lactonase YvrE